MSQSRKITELEKRIEQLEEEVTRLKSRALQIRDPIDPSFYPISHSVPAIMPVEPIPWQVYPRETIANR